MVSNLFTISVSSLSSSLMALLWCSLQLPILPPAPSQKNLLLPLLEELMPTSIVFSWLQEWQILLMVCFLVQPLCKVGLVAVSTMEDGLITLGCSLVGTGRAPACCSNLCLFETARVMAYLFQTFNQLFCACPGFEFQGTVLSAHCLGCLPIPFHTCLPLTALASGQISR